MEDKIISLDMFSQDIQTFGITSEPLVTFEVFDKDGVGPNPKYDAVRNETKICAVTLEKAKAPYTIKFTVHEVDVAQADKDTLAPGAVVL